MRLASEAFRAYSEQSLEGSKPAQLPDAVLQLLPKTLYRGEGQPQPLPHIPGTAGCSEPGQCCGPCR